MNQAFATAATAAAWPYAHPLDLGSLAAGPLAASQTTSLRVGLSLTTTRGGVYVWLMIGDAPIALQQAIT